jgi:hypothetical protein
MASSLKELYDEETKIIHDNLEFLEEECSKSDNVKLFCYDLLGINNGENHSNKLGGILYGLTKSWWCGWDVSINSVASFVRNIIYDDLVIAMKKNSNGTWEEINECDSDEESVITQNISVIVSAAKHNRDWTIDRINRRRIASGLPVNEDGIY